MEEKLPEFNEARVFSFVHEESFLQEEISTPFSFLLSWKDL